MRLIPTWQDALELGVVAETLVYSPAVLSSMSLPAFK
jgi:hypothetical protein